MQATIVFESLWSAINAKNEDGSRKYRYIILQGSSRSSKTHSIIQSHYLWGWKQPNSRISIWRDTKKDTKDTVLPDIKKALPSMPNNNLLVFNKTESIYTYPNGSTIEICGSDDETKVHGFQGNVLHFNEPYKMSKETFNQLDMRNADYIVLDWNPKQSHWIDDLSKLENAIVLHSTWKDNPFCPEEQRIKIRSYKPIKYAYCVHDKIISEKEAIEYDTVSNSLKLSKKHITDLFQCQKNYKYNTANEYDYLVYSEGLKSEKPNKIYKDWKIISYEEFMKLEYPEFYGLDFGQTNPTALVHVKYNDATFYAHELLYKPEREMKIGLVNEVKQVVQDKSIPMICDDASPLKWKELRQAGFNARPAKKGLVIDGISLLQKCNVFYTPESKNLEEEYDEYEWDSDRLGLIDKPVKAKDHILDGFRYASVYAQRKLRIVVE